MEYENRYEGFDEEVVQLIQGKARQLCRQGWVPEWQVPDYEQELALEVFQALRQFRPGQTPRMHFVRSVVKHWIARMILRQKAAKRGGGHRPESLHAERCNQDGEPVEAGDLLPRETLGRHLGRDSLSDEELAGLVLDTAEVLACLSAAERELCKGLKTQPAAAVARQLGIPRGTQHETIKKLRDKFARAGLSQDSGRKSRHSVRGSSTSRKRRTKSSEQERR